MPIFKKKIKTRFAPSPTGFLHIGGLRTALFSYLYAQQNKGKFLLRIEDTDQSRKVSGAEKDICKTLYNFGLQPDEGVIYDAENDQNIEKGSHGPYHQSKRIDLYKKYADKLIKEDKAYYCFCDSDRLEKVREKQIKARVAPRYDEHCRNLTADEIENNLQKDLPYVIRLKVPKNQVIKFDDVVRGEVEIKSENIDDQIIIKSDGFPTYHLAVVVDDHLMKITHVIRGEEWLPSTPKHVLLYQFLKWPTPNYVHLPLLLNPDKSKLSKRAGDTAAADYIRKGYLPEAVINFIALLGWHPSGDREKFSKTELIDNFKLNELTKAGAVFDIEKLNWFHQQYSLDMELDQYYKVSKEWLTKYEPDTAIKYNKSIAKIAQSRVNCFTEINTLFSHLLEEEIFYPADLLIFKKSDKSKTLKGLQFAYQLLSKCTLEQWNENLLLTKLQNSIPETGLSNGDVMWPIRVALSGKEKSEPVVEMLLALGKEKSLKRIDKAINHLQ